MMKMKKEKLNTNIWHFTKLYISLNNTVLSTILMHGDSGKGKTIIIFHNTPCNRMLHITDR